MPRPSKKAKTSVQRIDAGARYSEASVWNGVVYLAGQVASGDAASMSVEAQTKAVLTQIDELLAKAGTDKTNILRAQIFLTNLSDIAGMNSEWDKWVPQGNPPSRATVEAKLANPAWKIEVVVTAAIP